MAIANVVVLPGLFGSRLVTNIGNTGFVRTIWISPFSALTGELIVLQLAPDGLSPGPFAGGTVCYPFGMIEEEYGPLCDRLTRFGFNVLRGYYDWRLSIQVSAAQVLAGIQANIGQQPFYMVAHSMGGVVARAIWKLLVAQGLDAQVLSIITLGSPHWGSWEPFRSFFGLPWFYKKLQFIAGAYGYLLPSYRQDFLDAACASWPGFYELLPWKLSGPAFVNDPATAAAVYQVGSYGAGNKYVTQARLDAAAATQLWLGSAIPAGLNRFVCMNGKGFVCTTDIIPGNDFSQESGYVHGGGDGIVPTGYDVLPGAIVGLYNVFHGDMPLDGLIQPNVVNDLLYLSGQFGPK